MQAMVRDMDEGVEGIGNGIGSDPLEVVERFVRVIGRYAEGLFDYHDFGFSRCVIRDHIARVADGLTELRTAGNRPMMDLHAIDRDRSARLSPWDHQQSFRYAAGASMIMERFRPSIRSEDMPRAHAAIALLEFEADLLDDLIDATAYTEAEALAVYRHCLAPMTADSFDAATFDTGLRGLVKPGQEPVAELMGSIVG